MSSRQTRQPVFETVFRDEYSAVALVAGAVSGQWSDGEEAAQEAFVRAHRDWDRVGNLDRPGAWIRRVAINLALNQRRGNERRDRAHLRLAQETPASTFDGERHHPIWDAVAQLPPKQRAAVALHYHDGWSAREIAEILDTSVTAVTSSLHKARSRIAAQLGEFR